MWQLIETAPKDGTPVLGRFHSPRGAEVYVCWFDNKDPFWWVALHNGRWKPPIQPTHWMPMPEEPE